MCQIYVRYEYSDKLPLDTIQNEKYYNKDGSGIAYIEDNKIMILKSFDYDVIESKVRELEDTNKRFIVHFRMTTAGTNSIENIHPFKINDNLVMFHNGTIKAFKGNKDKSDTRLFAEYLRGLGVETLQDIITIKADIIQLIGTTYDKLVFMDNLGNIEIINDYLGTYSEQGNLWSSSVCPFQAANNSYDDFYDFRRTNSNITDNYGNFSNNELELLQYMMDYEPKRIKSVISKLASQWKIK
jgi:hypothetical protein